MRSLWFIAAVLVVGSLWLSAQDVLLSTTQPSGDVVVLASADETAQQSITSHHPGLTAVALRVEAPYPPDEQPVTLVVRETNTLALVVAVTLPFSATKGPCIEPCGPEAQGLWFALPNLPDSAERTYVLDVSTDGVPLRIAAHTLDMYSEGRLLRPTSAGDLVFRLDYNSQLGAMIPSVARQIAAGRPGIAGSIGWVPGIVLVYVLSVILVLRKSRALFAGW